MSENCFACGQSLPSQVDLNNIQAVLIALCDSRSVLFHPEKCHSLWAELYDEVSVNESWYVSRLGTVTKVAENESPYRSDSGYESRPLFMVFKVEASGGLIKHFKITGEYSSYVGHVWDGNSDFTSTELKTKTVTEWS